MKRVFGPLLAQAPRNGSTPDAVTRYCFQPLRLRCRAALTKYELAKEFGANVCFWRLADMPAYPRLKASSMVALDQIVDALLPEWPTLPPEHRASVSAHCARFVRRQIALSPAHIQFGVRVLFTAFVMFAFLHLGMRRLGSVARERRAAALRAFALEQVPPFVALERLLRSMTTVAFLEHPDVLTAIGEDPLPPSGPAAAHAAAP
jgi:hypothetical protein